MQNNQKNVKEIISELPEAASGLNNILNEKIKCPNIPVKVLDADMKIWETLQECNGWRLQQNQISRSCRILDPDDARRAWGTKNGMKEAFEELLHRADWQKEMEEWPKN